MFTKKEIKSKLSDTEVILFEMREFGRTMSQTELKARIPVRPEKNKKRAGYNMTPERFDAACEALVQSKQIEIDPYMPSPKARGCSWAYSLPEWPVDIDGVIERVANKVARNHERTEKSRGGLFAINHKANASIYAMPRFCGNCERELGRDEAAMMVCVTCAYNWELARVAEISERGAYHELANTKWEWTGNSLADRPGKKPRKTKRDFRNSML